MKIIKYLTLTAIAASFASTAALADDEKGKKPEKKKKPPTEELMKGRFAKADANSDKKVDLAELKAMIKKEGMAEKMMKAKDADGNGSLTEAEFTAKKKKGGGEAKKKKGDGEAKKGKDKKKDGEKKKGSE